MSYFAAHKYPAHIKAVSKSVRVSEVRSGDIVIFPDLTEAVVATTILGGDYYLQFDRDDERTTANAVAFGPAGNEFVRIRKA